MTPSNPNTVSRKKSSSKRYSALGVVFKSLLASGAVVGVLGFSIYLVAGTGLWTSQSPGDIVDQEEVSERQKVFSALDVMSLAVVPESEIDPALNSMGLSEAAKQTMLSNLAPSSRRAANSTNPITTTGVSAIGAVALDGLAPSPASRAPDSSPRPTVKDPPSLRLVWVTLWDTDAEDGDVVRIDSQGYFRTISLTKQPVTLAIPVPRSGTLNVTGIRDGEGGGITVGLASGTSRAVFPIMSVGQTLGLKVRIN